MTKVVKIVNQHLMTFPGLPIFWAEYFFVRCLHAGMLFWRENMNFRHFLQLPLYQSFRLAEQNIEEIIKDYFDQFMYV